MKEELNYDPSRETRGNKVSLASDAAGQFLFLAPPPASYNEILLEELSSWRSFRYIDGVGYTLDLPDTLQITNSSPSRFYSERNRSLIEAGGGETGRTRGDMKPWVIPIKVLLEQGWLLGADPQFFGDKASQPADSDKDVSEFMDWLKSLFNLTPTASVALLTASVVEALNELRILRNTYRGFIQPHGDESSEPTIAEKGSE